MNSQSSGLAGFELAITIGSAGGVAVLLLLLGYCLRRWQRKTRKGIARNVAGDPATDAFEQGATHTAGAVDAEPWPELLADSRPKVRDESVDSPPERMARKSFKQDRVKGSAEPSMPRAKFLPHAGSFSRMGILTPFARRTVAAAKEATGSYEPQPAFAAPLETPHAAQIATTTTPAPGCGASASSGGETSQAGSSAKEQLANVQHRPTSKMSCGKLAEAVEAAPTDKAARFRARKASITEGDDMFEGAKGTRDGPGRCVSSRRSSHTSNPDGQAVNTEMRLVSSTSSSSASPHGPNPPARKPDDLWAAVRERRADLTAARAAAAAASPNPDQGRHKVRARLSQERISVRV